LGTHILWHLHILVHDVHLVGQRNQQDPVFCTLDENDWRCRASQISDDCVCVRKSIDGTDGWSTQCRSSRWLNEILTGNQWPIRDQGDRISITLHLHPVLLDVTAISSLLHPISPCFTINFQSKIAEEVFGLPSIGPRNCYWRARRQLSLGSLGVGEVLSRELWSQYSRIVPTRKKIDK